MDQSQHRKGFLITLFGVLVLTPDSLLVRLADIDPMGLSFWRGILQGTVITIAMLLIYRSSFWTQVKAIGKTGIFVAVFFAICNISFIFSLENTTAANTLVIIATTSMWAALISFLLLKERINRPTLITMIVSFIGVFIVVSDNLGNGSWRGDVFALIAAISMAFGFTLIRRKSHVNMIPASALSAFIAAIATVAFIGPIAYSSDQWGAIVLVGAVVLPVSFACMTLGPRYIPSAEVSLLLLLETTAGPLWVWMGIGEEPSVNSLIGGAIVVTALMLHSINRLRRRKQKSSIA